MYKILTGVKSCKILKLISNNHDNILAIRYFDGELVDIPIVDNGLETISNNLGAEVWISDAKVNNYSFKHGWFRYTENEGLGYISISCEAIKKASSYMYSKLFFLMDKYKFPYLTRIWHTFPQLLIGSPNNYKEFCQVRHELFRKNNYLNSQYFPAATVIGSKKESDAKLFFLITKYPFTQIENQHQISSFNYPKVYSQYAPMFSRAVYLDNLQEKQLFISGTASIKGHKSIHINNFKSQLALSVENMENLIAQVNTKYSNIKGFSVVNIYLNDLNFIQSIVDTDEAFIKNNLFSNYRIFIGDICRKELLVELDLYMCNKLESINDIFY